MSSIGLSPVTCLCARNQWLRLLVILMRTNVIEKDVRTLPAPH